MLSNGQNPRRSQENGRNKAAIIRALCRIGRQVADLSHLAGLTTMLQTIALHESDCEIVDSATGTRVPCICERLSYRNLCGA
jgi:hypothetical protein